MKSIFLALLTLTISFTAQAQHYSVIQSSNSSFDYENKDCDPGHNGPGRGRGGGPGPASSCTLSQQVCGSTSGARGTIPGCTIKCYYGAVANCTPGSFHPYNDCEIQELNSCTCLGGY